MTIAVMYTTSAVIKIKPEKNFRLERESNPDPAITGHLKLCSSKVMSNILEKLLHVLFSSGELMTRFALHNRSKLTSDINDMHNNN